MGIPKKLHDAVELGDSEEILSILEELPPNKLQDFADIYLFTLTFEGEEGIVRYLHRHKMVLWARDEVGSTALHYAVLGGNLEIVQYLHQEGADIHIKDQNGTTLLHEAAISGNLSLVKYLCEQGLDANTVNINGQTALHLVVLKGIRSERATPAYAATEERKITTYLQQQGSDIGIVDKVAQSVRRLLEVWQEDQQPTMWINEKEIET